MGIGYGLVIGSLGDTAEVFALDAATGREVWRNDLSNNPTEGIDMAHIVYNNTVYISTVPGNAQGFYVGGGRGIFYALDVHSGAIRWSWDTTTDNLWGNVKVNSGGGLWYPPSVDDSGDLYFGTGNAAPWPGNEDFPSGSSRPGDNNYASSMVSLDPKTGSLRWYINAKPHDLFDLDFQNTPVLASVLVNGADTTVVFGSGKTGTIIAAVAESGEQLWMAAVGKHRNDDLQEIPAGENVEVYPGSGGGIQTPIAYANGIVFAVSHNNRTVYSSTEITTPHDYTLATASLVALHAEDGSTLWEVEIPTLGTAAVTVANDVVLTGGIDGYLRAYNAETGANLQWTFSAGIGLNAPPALSGDLLIIPCAGPLIAYAGDAAGSPVAAEATPVSSSAPPAPTEAAIPGQIFALRIPGADATPAATPTS